MARHVYLCKPCAEKRRASIDAAIANNPDKDAGWWEKFWDTDYKRYLKRMNDCCDNWLLGNDATKNKPSY